MVISMPAPTDASCRSKAHDAGWWPASIVWFVYPNGAITRPRQKRDDAEHGGAVTESCDRQE
jgi:hypothetical protein